MIKMRSKVLFCDLFSYSKVPDGPDIVPLKWFIQCGASQFPIRMRGNWLTAFRAKRWGKWLLLCWTGSPNIAKNRGYYGAYFSPHSKCIVLSIIPPSFTARAIVNNWMSKKLPHMPHKHISGNLPSSQERLTSLVFVIFSVQLALPEALPQFLPLSSEVPLVLVRAALQGDLYSHAPTRHAPLR